MKFLCDMGVARRVSEWLRRAGHDAVHLADEGLQRLPNGEIAHLCKVLTDSSDALLEGAIITVDDARHRVRRPPLP